MLTPHETKAVAGSVVSPATTAAAIREGGANRVLMTTTADIRWTCDGATDPAVGAGSEVGALLRSTDAGVLLSVTMFLNLKMLDVSTDARVQFEFLDVTLYNQ